MTYTFSLAGYRFRIDWPFELIADDYLTAFLYPATVGEQYAAEFSFSPGILPTLPEDAQKREYRFYSPTHPYETWHLCEENGPLSAWVLDNVDDNNLKGILSPEGLQVIYRFRNVIQLLQVERLLLRLGGMMLHASLIFTSLGGIIFSGDCGIGKSTQATLWEAHRGARILNGDRAGIVPAAKSWEAWGLPYAGTSGIYVNEGAPLRAIVLLGQGRENIMVPINAAEAFRALYPQINLHRWHPELCTLAADNLLSLLSAVPAYRLICRPDVSAVELLEQTLSN